MRRSAPRNRPAPIAASNIPLTSPMIGNSRSGASAVDADNAMPSTRTPPVWVSVTVVPIVNAVRRDPRRPTR